MKVISRSQWTSSYPKINTGTEDTELPNFRNKVSGITLVQPEENSLFTERDPFHYFDQLRKEDQAVRGYGDIAFNLGVATNFRGVFCLRGLCNRSPKSDRITILVLLGLDETPTDILLENLAAAEQLVTARWPGGLDIEGEELKSIPLPPVGNFNFQCQLPTTYNFNEPSVHIFELIEFLAYWGYYKGRNDGIYGSITRQAVRELQADLREGNLYHKRIDGVYGRYTREAFCTYMKQASQ